MANVVRTESQLFTLFADNIVGAITAQDGRDLVASVFGYPGTTAPSVSNDSVDTAGIGAFFDTGSVWVDTTHGEWYFCVVGTPGAAVWLPRCCTTPTGAFVVNSGGTGVTPLTVEGVAGQTAPLQQWQAPAGTTLAEVLATGQFESFLTNLTAWIVNQGSASQTVPFVEVLNFLGAAIWQISQYGEDLAVGLGVALASLAADYVFTRSDSILLVDAGAANRTITLPRANTFPAGRLLAIKKVDSSMHTVTIGQNIADLLEGAGALILAKQFDWAVLCSDGVSNWYILAANVDTALQNAGTVKSVAMTVPGVIFSLAGSPITTTGTLALSLLNQNANTVLAGPGSGAAAAPTFRALNLADMPRGVYTTLEYTVQYTQLTAAGAVSSVNLALASPMPTYSIVYNAYYQILAANSFTGGSTMGVTAQFTQNGTVFGASIALKVGSNTQGQQLSGISRAFNFFGTTTDILGMTFTISGDTLNHLTQGTLTLWVIVSVLPPP